MTQALRFSVPRTRSPPCKLTPAQWTSCSNPGVLEDVGGNTDDIQKELDEAGSSAEVDKEFAALKAEVGSGSTSPPELTGS